MTDIAVLDAKALRMLTHPLRWQILAEVGLSRIASVELAARFPDVDINTFWWNLRALERNGLLVRERLPADRRESMFQLGRRTLEELAGRLLLMDYPLDPKRANHA